MWKYSFVRFLASLIVLGFSTCAAKGPAIQCDEKPCVCKSGYILDENSNLCYPLATLLGDECNIFAQCKTIEKAHCLNNKCTVVNDSVKITECSSLPCICEDGLVLAPNNLTCLSKAKKEEDPCYIKEQCANLSSLAQCINNKCIVDKYACKNGSACYFDTFSEKHEVSFNAPAPKQHQLGGSCSSNEECLASNSMCSEKICKCKNGFISSQNLISCLPKAKTEGEKCTETLQCTDILGAVCDNEKCTKLAKVAFSTSFPELDSSKLIIGSTCQEDKECQHLPNALCKENVCQCSEGYITSVSSSSCLAKAKKEGDACQIDKQCEDVKGTCSGNVCINPAVPGTKLGKANSSTVGKLSLSSFFFLTLSIFL